MKDRNDIINSIEAGLEQLKDETPTPPPSADAIQLAKTLMDIIPAVYPSSHPQAPIFDGIRPTIIKVLG